MTKNFPLHELVRSQTAARHGFLNEPTPAHLANLRLLAEGTLQPCREAWGGPLVVTSGYRTARLNKIIKGHPQSYHKDGLATDLVTVGGRSLDDLMSLYAAERATGAPRWVWDKVIIESIGGQRWIHVQRARAGKKNRFIMLSTVDGRNFFEY